MVKIIPAVESTVLRKLMELYSSEIEQNTAADTIIRKTKEKLKFLSARR